MSALAASLNLALAVARTGVTGNLLADNVITTAVGYDLQESQYVTVANLAVDQALSLGPLAAAGLVLIVSDQPVSFKINGSIAIAATTLLLMGAAVTSLSVSNSSGSKASLRLVLLGA